MWNKQKHMKISVERADSLRKSIILANPYNQWTKSQRKTKLTSMSSKGNITDTEEIAIIKT